MSQIDTVLLKVSSRCNIDCDYCYMYRLGDLGWTRMPKVMSDETIAAVIHSLSELATTQGADFAVVLHGGEPLLLGAAKLRALLCGLRTDLPSGCRLSIQTNGVLLTREILDLCSETRTSVAISLDGPERVHNMHRVGFDGRGTFAEAMAAIRLIREHPKSKELFDGTLSVIDPRTEPEEVYLFFKELRVPSTDFLYRDGNHSRLPHGKASFESTEYGQWLARLWELYVADPDPIRINVLDDITRLILGGQGTKEGSGIHVFGIVIIDTDGTIAKNDTLKSSYDGADRFRSDWSVHTHRLADVVDTEEFQVYSLLQHPTSELCRCCPYLRICGGGMPLYRWRDDNGYDNPSVYCNDHRHVIQHVYNRLPVVTSCQAP